MARLAAPVVTLIFLVATCFFAFETHSKVADLVASVQTKQSALDSAQQEEAADKARTRTAMDDTAKAKSDLAAAQAQAQTVQSNLDAANTTIDGQKQQIDTLQKQIAGMPTTPGPSAPQGPSQQDFDKVNAQLKDAQAQVAELNEVEATLKSRTTDAEARAGDLQKIIDQQKAHVLRNGLEGEVLAVNQGWNFVVLSIGDRQGAVADAEMILERDGNQIGKVRITSVEPSTSVADIIPGSLARGVRVEPGDHVIFPGT
jgi:DNA repair exonuclease SbcCD ATPase subunit